MPGKPCTVIIPPMQDPNLREENGRQKVNRQKDDKQFPHRVQRSRDPAHGARRLQPRGPALGRLPRLRCSEWLGGIFRKLIGVLSETAPSFPLAFSQPRYQLRRDSIILKERL